jgi:hypothetical protein
MLMNKTKNFIILFLISFSVNAETECEIIKRQTINERDVFVQKQIDFHLIKAKERQFGDVFTDNRIEIENAKRDSKQNLKQLENELERKCSKEFDEYKNHK